MLKHLLGNPDDYVGAFRKLPNNLQLMTVHSLQSVVFNKTIEARIGANIPSQHRFRETLSEESMIMDN